MGAPGTRDLTATTDSFRVWLAADLARRGIEASELELDLHHHTGGGYSNEILFVTAAYRVGGDQHRDRLVVRLPPVTAALFATYDLPMEVAVQDAVAGHGVPVPHPLVLEPDPAVLGSPFLVMPRIEGHDVGELPVADPWIAAASEAQQRSLHLAFLDALAGIHTTPWRDRPVADHLRGASGTLDDEIRWWDDLVRWIFDGSPPGPFTDLLAWCRTNRPSVAPEAGVLWGDVRLGNAIFGDDFAPIALLDWEMASIGPAELDLAWYTALEGMTEHFFGQRIPGFLTRDEIVARHEQAIGRALVDFRWFEIFAMVRSSALNIRAERLEAQRRGKDPRPVEGNAVLAYATDAMAHA